MKKIFCLIVLITLSIFILIKKLLKFLNSNESVENISFSLTIALAFSLIPLNFIVHALLLIILIAFNGNLFIFLFMSPILMVIMPTIYIELHKIGEFVLTQASLTPTYEAMSDITILMYTNWNNTISMGGYIAIIILSIPIYYFYKISIQKYRDTILPKLKNSRIVHVLKLPNWLTLFKK